MADMTLEEALAAASIDEELVTPVDEVFLINPETRTINVPDSEKLFGARQDMDVERKYFKCPRIVGDNIDLLEHHIYVSYVSSKQDGTYSETEEVGKYHCEDLSVDGEYITFSWLLSANVFRKSGYIAFAVYAKQADEEGNLKTKWHTTIAVGNVLDTLPDGNQIIERYPDVIEQILEHMDRLDDMEAVSYSEQDLTEEQKTQARTNIGAASAEQVSKLSKEIADLKENGTAEDADRTELMEETEILFTLNSTYGLYSWFTDPNESPFAFIEGEEYVVVWDETEYTFIAKTASMGGMTGIGVGNLGILGIDEDTGEPFVFAYSPDYNQLMAFSNDTEETAHTVTIYQNTTLIGLPTVTNADNGKFLQVVNGKWTAVAITDGSEVAW